jgi:hypothetical protein
MAFTERANFRVGGDQPFTSAASARSRQRQPIARSPCRFLRFL